MSEPKRFQIYYLIVAPDRYQAEDICTKVAIEQSVESPIDVLSDEIRSSTLGQLESLSQQQDTLWKASISYSCGSLGPDITQLLNVVFGNVSLFRGVKITGLQWSALPEGLLPGPAFGIQGVRKHHNIATSRALSCAVIKPIGLTSTQLARYCYEFALGGIDIIKDDHGLANQHSAPFAERLAACVDATRRAADKTGEQSAYYPHITADGSQTMERYEQAYEAGAGGVLVIPHLCAPGILAELSRSEIPLPVMAHPAFSGSYVLHKQEGMEPAFLFGELWRELGADFSIYPHAAGRFALSAMECLAINESCRNADGAPANNCFPAPGGGVQRQTLPELLARYGNDTVFLIGGSLYQHPKGITYASRELADLLHDHA